MTDDGRAFRRFRRRRAILGMLGTGTSWWLPLALSTCTWASVALSQEAAEPVEATPPAAVEETAPPPATEPVPVEEAAEVETAAATETTAPAPTDEAPEGGAEKPPEEGAEKPAEDDFSPSLTVGAGLRTGLNVGLRGPTEGEVRLDDGLVDQANIRPFMSAALIPHVSFFVQFEIGTPNGLGTFAILDAIAQIKFIDELQLWVGQHIPANDRNNNNGPFFGNLWNFPIAVEEYPFDTGARDRGFTFWGLIAGGVLKYHLSMVDLQPGRDLSESRFGARLTLHLLEPEAFYYNSGTYWGEKDVLAFGAVLHGQQGDDGGDNDLLGFSFDAFFEKNFGSVGTFTAEAGYWNFEGSGANYIVNQNTLDTGLGIPFPMTYPGSAGMGIVSWLAPGKIGYGKVQLNAGLQYADWAPEQRTVFDAGLAYVIDGFNHKYHFNYRHAYADANDGSGSTTADMIQFGVQYMMAR